MFSEMIREALLREVVGQPDAVASVARGVTRLVSELTPSERSWCAHLFIGPHGTGRAHLVRSLARILHGEESLLTVNCKVGGQVDPWNEFLRHLEPLIAAPSGGAAPAPGGPAPGAPAGLPGAPRTPRLVLVQDLERSHKDFFPQLAHLLESGQEALPGGRRLRLDGCMFFFTSGLCADQILDEARIGFAGTAPSTDDEHGALYKVCREQAEQAFGADLVGQLDDLIVFQRLDGELLADTLDRHFARMSRWLAGRGIRCELRASAKEYLLSLAGGEPLRGAVDLMRVHRNEVEFPLADLLVSRALSPGGEIALEHRPGEPHLHFSVSAPEPTVRAGSTAVREIPVLA